MKYAVTACLLAAAAVWLQLKASDREQVMTKCLAASQSRIAVFEAVVEFHEASYDLILTGEKNTPFLPERLILSSSGLPMTEILLPGERYLFTGSAFCRFPHQNPSMASDFRTLWIVPHWHLKITQARVLPQNRLLSSRTRFLRRAFAPLEAYPRLASLARATWTGETGFQKREVVEFFRVTGALPILALSGQHVGILLVLVEGILGWAFVFWWQRGKKGPVRVTEYLVLGWRRYRLLVGATVLLITSGGLGSMKRTWFMALFYCLLKRRALGSAPLQWVCSSCAFVLIFDSATVWQPGFFLSACGTFLLFRLSEMADGFSYLMASALVASVMPLLAWPWTAHFFSKLAWLSPLLSGALSFLWNVLVLPAGFLIPGVIRIVPPCGARFLGEQGEALLARAEVVMERWLPAIRQYYFTTLRPGLGEAVALEGFLITLLVVLFLKLRHCRWFPRQNNG